jgi:hypothetical protein
VDLRHDLRIELAAAAITSAGRASRRRDRFVANGALVDPLLGRALFDLGAIAFLGAGGATRPAGRPNLRRTALRLGTRLRPLDPGVTASPRPPGARSAGTRPTRSRAPATWSATTDTAVATTVTISVRATATTAPGT